MRRVLAAAVLMAFVPTGHAQDQGKADFSHNAEYRARYLLQQNPTGNEKDASTYSGIDQRFKLGTMFRASEKFGAGLTFMHNATWGHTTTTETVGDTAGGATTENYVSVNEAFATWMASEEVNLKIGRQNFQIGDGSVMAINDWEATPYAFEGVSGTYDLDFGRFTAFGFKYKELTDGGNHPSAGSSSSADPEMNAYGLVFDMKTMPEWLTGLNVHLIQDTGDAISGAAVSQTGNPMVNDEVGHNVLRYGLNAGFMFQMIDLKAWYNVVTGKYKSIDATGTKTELDAEQSMYQAELGVNLPELMGSRFHLAYHVDSGDNDTSDKKAKMYDSYFYELHANAGLMDIFKWGNLSYTQIGWTGKPADATSVGLAYTMFTKTEKGSTTKTASGVGQGGYGLGSGSNDKDDLGKEIDVWATHTYDGGLATTLRVGHFTPGDAYDNTTIDKKDNYTQVMLEGRFSF